MKLLLDQDAHERFAWRCRRRSTLATPQAKANAQRVAYEGHLMQAAIRVTNEVRGSIDIAKMLETTVVVVANTLEIEHCCLRFDSDSGDNRNESAFACSCGESEHDPDTEAAFTSALSALEMEGRTAFFGTDTQKQADADSELNTFPVLGLPISRDGIAWMGLC